MQIRKIKCLFYWYGKEKYLTGKEIENIIYAIGLIGWIPILAIFSGIAKVISAFKGNYTGGNGVNIDIKHISDDCGEEE